MCLICIEFQKGKLTVFEAKKNLVELYTDVGLEHTLKVLQIVEGLEDLEKVKDGVDLK
jgi:hypothetical protein